MTTFFLFFFLIWYFIMWVAIISSSENSFWSVIMCISLGSRSFSIKRVIRPTDSKHPHTFRSCVQCTACVTLWWNEDPLGVVPFQQSKLYVGCWYYLISQGTLIVHVFHPHNSPTLYSMWSFKCFVERLRLLPLLGSSDSC